MLLIFAPLLQTASRPVEARIPGVPHPGHADPGREALSKKRHQQMGNFLEKRLNHQYRFPFYPALFIKPEKTA